METQKCTNAILPAILNRELFNDRNLIRIDTSLDGLQADT